jgi:hypothetical protein
MFEALFGTDMPLAVPFFIAFLIIGLFGLIIMVFYLGRLVIPVRRLIVSTFETVCIALVLIPTGLIVLVTPFMARPFAGVIVAGLTFIVTAFLAGGALTLVSIADSTQELVKILQRIEKTELHAIADDVHRIEGAGRDARNQAAVSAAMSPSSASGT